MLTGPNTNIAKGSGIVLLGGDTVLVLDTGSSLLWSIDASSTSASAGSSFSGLPSVTSAATYGPLSSSLGLLLNSGLLYLLSGSSSILVASSVTITSFVAAPDGSHFAYLQTSSPAGLYGTTGSSSGGAFSFFCLLLQFPLPGTLT